MLTRKRQQGLTFISWLVILVVIGFFVLIALKVTPVYMEHFSVKAALESLKNEPLISRKPVSEIRKMLNRRLDMNSIYSLTKDQILIDRRGGVTTVRIKYEERRNIVGNMSLVMSFDDSIELISN
ncbi:MAG: DUF4845 domain-containing protein [Candidatus Thiodiazotropha sp.]